MHIINFSVKRIIQNIKSTLKRGSIKNFFKLDSLLKIIFLYIVTVFYIILFNYNFHGNFTSFLNHSKAPRVVIYGIEERIGENILRKEIASACIKNGWQVISIPLSESLVTYSLTRHFYLTAANIINFLFKPEFALSTTHYTYIVPHGFNILYVNVPYTMLVGYEDKFLPHLEHLKDFDGYIDIHAVMDGKNEWLKRVLKEQYNKKLIIPGYLARGKVSLSQTEFNKALITGSLWGCNRGALRFKKAIKRLAEEGLIDAIGLKEEYAFLNDSYKHLVHDNDGLIDEMHHYGIGLIIHNLEHIIEAIPTNRIAEAIASNSIAISDKHPFIEKYFKDNVLYFDSLQTEDKIYNQIKQHINWIKAHPDKAQIKVRNTIAIFNEKFALEPIMQSILEQVREFKNSK